MMPRKLNSFVTLLTPGLVWMALAFLQVSCEKPTEEGAAAPPSSSNSPGIPPGKRQLTPDEQRLVLDGIMKAKAKEQAEGLGSGKVTVNGAWNYSGYSILSPDPNAAIEVRLVAVDITVAGHTANFDIDDIEIVDGASLMSYGSDPHATPLNLEGGLLKEKEFHSAPPKANRWLLIYGYPKKSPSFHLYYWGKELTGKPVEIADRGFELPYPPKE